MIYLVRHGETDWNKQGLIQGQEDVPLNLNGIKQAMEKRDFFSGHHLRRVVTSPLKRASKTAEILTSKAQVDEYVKDPKLIEFDFGARSGTTGRLAFNEDGTEVERETPIPADDEENEEEFLQRIVQVLVENAAYDGNIVLVSHGAVLGTIIRSLLPEEYQDRRVPLHNCSVSAIDSRFDEDGNLVLTLLGINLEKEDVDRLLTEND